jgi:hypothetical protein
MQLRPACHPIRARAGAYCGCVSHCASMVPCHTACHVGRQTAFPALATEPCRAVPCRAVPCRAVPSRAYTVFKFANLHKHTHQHHAGIAFDSATHACVLKPSPSTQPHVLIRTPSLRSSVT